jgi:LCP family protein required for cell wall assembly
MKLSGNKRDGRYSGAAARSAAASQNRRPTDPSNRPENVKTSRAQQKRRKARRAQKLVISIVVIFIALSAVLYSVYKLGVRPPEIKPRPPVSTNASPSAGTEETAAPGAMNDRISKYDYTFVIMGIDRVSQSTDTLMVANFDAVNHKINVVNIPRDTLVNVKWNTKKINTLYSQGGMDGVVSGLNKILGFDVDFYVLVDLDAFKKLVDAVDGVQFDVPKDMNYDDPAQDLHIHLKKGMQTLDGEHAMQLVRCRSVYATADIGRIETQQAFLKAAIEQILQKRDKLNITELANIFLTNVETDLDVGEIGWLAKEFLKMDSTNISFEKIPADYWDTVNGVSYVTIYVNDWLQMLNEKINPFVEDIKAEDLSIYTRDSKGKLYVTDGNYAGKATWGGGGGSSSTKPSSSSKPSPSAESSPSPSPSHSATPSPDKETTATPDSGTTTTPDTSTGDTSSGSGENQPADNNEPPAAEPAA